MSINTQDGFSVVSEWQRISRDIKDETQPYSADSLSRMAATQSSIFTEYYATLCLIFDGKNKWDYTKEFVQKTRDKTDIQNVTQGYPQALTRKSLLPDCSIEDSYDMFYDTKQSAVDAYSRKCIFDELMKRREREREEEQENLRRRALYEQQERERKERERERAAEQERIRNEEQERKRKEREAKQKRQKTKERAHAAMVVLGAVIPPACLVFGIIAWIVLGEYISYSWLTVVIPFCVALISAIVATVIFVRGYEHTACKAIGIITIIIAAILIIPGSVVGNKEKEYYALSGDLYYNKLPDGTLEVTALKNKEKCPTTIKIPDKVGFKKVTRIGSSVFYDCRNLISVTIGNSVTSIGCNAFYNCNGLTSVTIGNGVTSIEWDAFSGCSSLTSLVIPDSVTSIERDAFSGCSSLTSVTMGNGVTNIDSRLFYNCSSLTSVTIGNSVTSIEWCAFGGCSSLTNITIPDRIESIDGRAFSDCGNLQYNEYENGLYLGNSKNLYLILMTIKDKAVAEFNMSDATKRISNEAFDDCNSLTSVTIGNSVTNIDNYLFSYCSSLTSVTIGNSVTSIGNHAFYGCGSLTKIVIPKTVKNIEYEAFYSCSSLTIYAETDSKPNGWKDGWNIYKSEEVYSFGFGTSMHYYYLTVVWGYVSEVTPPDEGGEESLPPTSSNDENGDEFVPPVMVN